jgi:FkbM family methyltransferase
MHIAHAVGPSGRVIAFEPVPDNFQRLERNIRLNELSQVTPVCAAAADREGVTSFTFEPDLPSQGKIAKDGGLTVQQMTLDGHFKRWGAPSYMKIDVEGGAGGVLDGAKDLIAAHRPTIYIETHNAVEMSAVDSFLATHRYRAHAIDGRAVSARLTTADSPLMLRPV